jgi:hypothetical protein
MIFTTILGVSGIALVHYLLLRAELIDTRRRMELAAVLNKRLFHHE